MYISVPDGSNYLKGLLLLIRKDNKITKEEHGLITRIGKNLGFDETFIEEALQEILHNRFISITPPVFSTKLIAEKFLKDGLVIAASDNEIHSAEEEWLLSVAEKNNIGKEWIFVEKSLIRKNGNKTVRLEADSLRIKY